MKVYERIKYLRRDRGMSQEDLGKLLGVTKATILKYENGRSETRKAISSTAIAWKNIEA